MSASVLVLMSTYNGEKYLREQIESILAQEGVDVRLLVRDDGSTDTTPSILEEYQAQGALRYYVGENLGPQLSFMHLLFNAPRSDYYAFADQDDVWMKDKLAVAVGALKGHADEPALYLAQTQLTDKRLRTRRSVIVCPRLTFGEALIYKFAAGCTMAFNHPLREKLGDKAPTDMPMHDIWIYTFALAIKAHVTFDKTPRILYRQHESNTVGQGQGFWHEWGERLHRFMGKGGIRHHDAALLLRCYKAAIPQDHLALLERFVDGKHSFRKRLGLLADKDIRCNHALTQTLFWVELLLNKY